MSWKNQSSRTNNENHNFVNTQFLFSDNPENSFPGSISVEENITTNGSIYIASVPPISIFIDDTPISDTSGNTAIGFRTFKSNTTGTNNSAFGALTLNANTNGYENVAVGSNALLENTIGYENVAVGSNALLENTIGGINVAVGYNALRENISGGENVAVGSNALRVNIGGDINVAVGGDALSSNTNGNNNVAVGGDALASNTIGSNNVAVGSDALLSNTIGIYNVAVGVDTLIENISGNNNVAIGFEALRENISGNDNVAVGTGSLRNNIASYNTAVGVFSLSGNTIGEENAAFGYHSLSSNDSGDRNSAFGFQALSSNTNGNNNSAFGASSLATNFFGSNNSAFGFESLNKNSNGASNSAFGYRSLYNNINAINNSAFGFQALYNNTGNGNSAFGIDALQGNIIGSNNTAIGRNALRSGLASNANNNTVLGYQENSLMMPDISNSTAIGYNSEQSISGSNQVILGNDQISRLVCAQSGITVHSDERLKSDIKDIDIGVDFINELRPVSYYRTNDENKEIEYGIIAQELDAILKKYNITNAGIIYTGAKGYYGVRYNDFIPILMKSVQELDSKIQIHKISEPQFIDCDVDGNIPHDLILTLSNEYDIWQIKIDELILNPNESKSFTVTYGDSLTSNSIITCDLVNNFNPATGDVSPMSLTIGDTGDPKLNNKKIWITNINSNDFYGSVEMIIKSTK